MRITNVRIELMIVRTSKRGPQSDRSQWKRLAQTKTSERLRDLNGYFFRMTGARCRQSELGGPRCKTVRHMYILHRSDQCRPSR